MNAQPQTFESVNAQLLAHTGDNTGIMTRDDLRALATPEPTATWRPIPHADLADEIEAGLERLDISIRSEQFTTLEQTNVMFGTMKLSYGREGEYGAALGIRTSNNQTLAMQLMVGANIFVCDNMAFSGGRIVMNRKHTSGLNINDEITVALGEFVTGFESLEERIAEMKTGVIEDSEAERVIYRAFAEEMLPVRHFHGVREAYFNPPHEEFEPRNRWSLHNAFTEELKNMKRLAPRQEATRKIGQLFGM